MYHFICGMHVAQTSSLCYTVKSSGTCTLPKDTAYDSLTIACILNATAPLWTPVVAQEPNLPAMPPDILAHQAQQVGTLVSQGSCCGQIALLPSASR